MNETLLRLYHGCPPPVRSLFATARGYQLRSDRYGPETNHLVQAALDREHWTEAQWQSWRDERLPFILHRAATRVPYYREQWAERRRRGDRASWERIENWPVLEKDVVRRNNQAFVADDCNPRRMIGESTSGTSGKPVQLWRSRETSRAWYALFEARCRLWYGLSRKDRWAILGGQLVAPASQAAPPFWVWNRALRQLYCSVYHLSPELAPEYLDAFRRHRIQYIVGYTSALEVLAAAALRRSGPDLRLRVVLTNAEPVFPHQREIIEAAFHCPMRETYGMSEIVAAASECGHGALHLWPEAGYLEILDEGRPVSQGSAGELIATSLLNPDMPLIRYRTGDRCALADAAQPCTCGRRTPVLAAVEGRTDDVLYTRSGRVIGRLDPVFKSQLPIQEAQIVQESLDRIRVLYVPDREFDSTAGTQLMKLLKQRLGEIDVVLEAVERIPRGANGKFRAVVCNLPVSERISLNATPDALEQHIDHHSMPK